MSYALRSSSGSLVMLAAIRRDSSGGVAALLATHQPQELGFVKVAVFGLFAVPGIPFMLQTDWKHSAFSLLLAMR